MKKFYFYAKAFVLAMSLAVVPACSDDDEVILPDFSGIHSTTVSGVQPGSTTNVSFDANLDWTLSSNAMWCLFSNNSQTMSGQAGSQQIAVTVTDDAWSIEDATAEITLTMGGESQVIATITRAGMPLEVLDGADGTAYSAENPVVIEYSNNTTVSSTINLYANFAWTLSSAPEWLTVESESGSVSADANQLATVTLTVNSASIANEQEGVLVLQMKDNESRTYSVPVSYTGMGEGDIRVTFNNATVNSPYNWNVSQDGATFWQDDMMSEEEPTVYNFPLNMTVNAAENNYTVVALAEVYNYGSPYMSVNEELFYTVEDDGNGNVTIGSFQSNANTARPGYIMVMPKSLFDSLSAQDYGTGVYLLLNPDGNDLSDDYVVNVDGRWTRVTEENIDAYSDSEYFKPSSMVKLGFKQEGAAASEASMRVLIQNYLEQTVSVGYGSNADAEMAQAIISEFGLTEDKVFNVTVSRNAWISIYPELTSYFDDNTSCQINADYTNIWDMTGSPLTWSDVDAEASADPMNPMSEDIVCLTLQAKQSMVIRFVPDDESMMATKALIVYVE